MSSKTGGVAVPADFDPAPGVGRMAQVAIGAAPSPPPDADAVGVLVATAGAVPDEVGHDRSALEAAGFAGKAGQALVLPRSDGPPLVLVGVGEPGTLDADGLRNAAGTFARSAGSRARLALLLPSLEGISPRLAGQVATEGVLLAGYRYDVLQTADGGAGLEALTLVADDGQAADLEAGRGAGRCSRGPARCRGTWPTARRRTSARRRWPRSRSVSARPAAWRSRCSTRRRWSSSVAAVSSV